MGEKSELSRTDESLDALLRQMARMSGTPPRPEPQLSVGTSLLEGRFQILGRIGEGGMGLVYEARDDQRRSNVALKTLTRLDAGNVYRLKNEFRSLADVSHRNLVHLHELFGEPEHWFFTMELVDGERFDDWVRPLGNLDEARLRAALPQLYAGIAAIHAAGKLHRDLKPSNVLVTHDGRVVVLDFGLAVDPEAGGIGQTLRDQSVSGTPAYMAPEQAAGMPAASASDFYALGVMLFEALTGKLPFEGSAAEMLVDKQRADAPRVSQSFASTPSQAPLPLPGDLAALCDALLARDPCARPDQAALRTALGAQRSIGGSGAVAVHRRAQLERDVLLGRERELTELREAYEGTRAGKPVVMFVSGESGIGKSALCQTFLDGLRAEGHAAVLAGRCHERESVPFKGMDSLVDDLSRFLHKLPHADASALMPREVYALARIFPALGRIDAVAQSPKKDIVDPQELRLRAFAAFCELLARIRDRRPLVLYIDDVQWLDRDALTFLGYVLAQHEPAAALLLLSHRSEGAPGHALLSQVNRHLQQNARFERRDLTLGPLLPDAARELATQLLGTQHAHFAAEVAAESSGSPFFVQELSRRAQRSNGATSPTLHEALHARVHGLSEGARHLLELLAVAGRPLCAELALDAARAIHEHIDALHAERLVRRSDGGQERSVECYHDKIRESVVQALSAERLRALHGSLLAALLLRPDAEVEHLTLHAQGADDLEAAARYAAQAALRASELMAFDQAALLYTRALELGTHSEVDRRELQTKLGEALANAGRGADAARTYLDAAQGARDESALDFKRQALEQLFMSGHIDEGKVLLGEILHAEGLELPRGFTLVWERAQFWLRRPSVRKPADGGTAAHQRELDLLWSVVRGLSRVDFSTGAALLRRYTRLALDSGLPEHAARALSYMAVAMSANRGPAAKVRADALLERAEGHARASGRSEVSTWVQLYSGLAAFMQTDYATCRPRFARALEALSEQGTGVAFELCTARLHEQAASAHLGDFAPAAQLAALVDDAWRRGDLHAAIMLTSSSATARLVRGDAAGVQRHLEQARFHWRPSRDYNMLDLTLLSAELRHALYSNELKRGLERLQASWPDLESARLLRSPARQITFRGLRASLVPGRMRLGDADAPGLRALARDDARVLARLRLPLATAVSQLIEAGLAIDTGQPDHAVRHLRGALTIVDAAGMLPTGQAVRRRLGQLIGGEEGAMLLSQAESALRAMGAVDLEAATRLFAFGCDAA